MMRWTFLRTAAYTYPYQELSSFASLLQQLKFEEAKKAIRSFFQTAGSDGFSRLLFQECADGGADHDHNQYEPAKH